VIDPHNLELSLFINDQRKQQDNTGNMYFKIGETLEYITRYVTLHPGDLILTGTPHGIGQVKVGDKIKAMIKQNNNILVEMNYNVEEERH
jgi:acylpyruvate hydrolase